MKALVTGAAGFIGSHLSERLLTVGATVTGLDCFTDYYPRERKERNLVSLRGAAGFTFVEASLADADLAGATRRRDARVPPRRASGRPEELGTGFSRLYRQQRGGDPDSCSRHASDGPIERLVYASSSSVYGDEAPLPMREDVRLQPVSPYGVTKLAAEQLCYLYHVNHGVPAVSLRYFTVYGPRQRPDMGFSRFIRAAMRGEAVHAVRRRPPDPRLHVRGRCRGGDGRRRDARDARAVSTISVGDRVSSSWTCSG